MILAAIATAVVLAYSTIWYLAIFTMIPCLSGVVGFILVLVALLVSRLARTKESPESSRTGKGLLLAGVFFLIQITYFPIAIGLRDREVSQAKDFVEALIPKLEEYESLNVTYPASIDAVLTGDERVPRLLQPNSDFPFTFGNRSYYFQQDATYGFRFFLPDGFIGFQYRFCCGANGEWTVSD